jgi:hypothetical protein
MKNKKPVRYLPDEKVMQFAQDVLANKYFLSTQIHESQLKTLLHLVFIPLAFLDKKGLRKMQQDDVVVIYEEVSKHVGGRSINGYPFFGSCAMLTRADWMAVHGALVALEEAIKKASTAHELVMKDNDQKARRKDKGNPKHPAKVGEGGKEVPGPQGT